MRNTPILRQQILLALLGLLAVAYLPFQRVQTNDFVNYDDYRYVLDNREVRRGLTIEGVTWAFTNLEAGFWHPLTWLSHMLDCELYGVNPKGHHLSSLLLHIANTLLLFLFLQRTTRAFWRSAFAAALFAVHPLHVESVAWVSQRKDLLSTLFWNLSLLCYAAYAEAPGKLRLLVTLLVYCLGLMAKSMLVTLPLVLLLLDYWPLGRVQPKRASSLPPLLAEKAPFLAMSILFSIITFLAEKGIDALPGLESYPVRVRLFNAIVSYATYPFKMIWPADLSVIYLHPGSFPFWQVVLGLLFVLSVSLLVAHQSKMRPYLMVGWLWYMITLIPVIGFVQIGSHAYADRYTYIPLTGLFIMIVWGFPLDRLPERTKRFLPGSVMAGVLLVLGLISWHQVGHWKDSVALFRRAVQIDPQNFLAHNHLGFALALRGRFQESSDRYRMAIELKPNYLEALFNLANVLEVQGRSEEAVHYYRRVLAIQPSLARPHVQLGKLLLGAGKRDEALIHFQEAVRLDPSDQKTMRDLKRLQGESGIQIP